MERERRKGRKVIAVGDGYSDQYLAGEADIVFAKRDLLKICKERKIGCIEFESQDDVIEGLSRVV